RRHDAAGVLARLASRELVGGPALAPAQRRPRAARNAGSGCRPRRGRRRGRGVATMPTLGEILTRGPVSVSPDQTVSEVAAEMAQGRVGSAVVRDGAWLSGIVTERDILRAAASGKDLTSVKVSDWMTPDPVTAEKDMDAEDAVQSMISRG